MLDLNFVRENLALVEDKLRARGMDPTAVLGNFRELDVERSSRITQVETLQAQRNKLSQEVARSRKAGADATPGGGGNGPDTRARAGGTEELEQKAAQAEGVMRETASAGIPNLTQDSVPGGKERSGQC